MAGPSLSNHDLDFFSNLPFDVSDKITGFVGTHGWRELRLTCKYLNNLATPHLYKTIPFELTQNGCNGLWKVAHCPILSPCVKNLVLRRTIGLRDFGKPSKWRWALDLPGCPRNRFTHLPRVNSDCVVDAGLLTHSQWLQLPFYKKDALYEEYEAERTQHKHQMLQLAILLQPNMPGCTPDGHLLRASPIATSTDENVIRRFRQALGSLTNLTAFSHEPGAKFDTSWGCKWRDLRFNRAAVLSSTPGDEDEDVEALQLSVALHAIGQTPALYQMKKISITIDGPAFWGWERLRNLWAGRGCGLIRAARSEFGSAREADRISFQTPYHDEEESHRQMMWYSRELCIIMNALNNLTRLDCFVTEDADSGALSTVVDPIFELLCRADRLQRLGLGFRHPQHQPHEVGVFFTDNGATILLNRLSERKPWLNIKEIHLRVSTDESTLLAFLTAHKKTLRALTLSHVDLAASASWDSALCNIGKSLKLENLNLFRLCDVVRHDDGMIKNVRILFDPRHRTWYRSKQYYNQYYKNVVQRILRGDGQDSLEPESFFKQMEAGTRSPLEELPDRT